MLAVSVCLPACLSAPPARLSVVQATREESLCCSRDSNLIRHLRLCGASSVLHRVLDQCPAKIMLLWFHVDHLVAAGKSSERSLWAKTSFSGEMSAVSSEQNQAGEQNRTGTEPELQKAGVLEPQTVFVILDSSETLNLVRWVRKFWEVPLLQQRQTPFKFIPTKYVFQTTSFNVLCVVIRGDSPSKLRFLCTMSTWTIPKMTVVPIDYGKHFCFISLSFIG